MKKFASVLVVALLALLATLSLAPAASAYPDVAIDLSVNRQTVYGGEQFTSTASSDVDCTWTVEWNGDTRTSGATTQFQTTFTAPDVTKVTEIPLHGTCAYDAPSAARTNARALAGSSSWSRTIVITVLPAGNAVAAPGDAGVGAGGDLPNTGGPNFWFLAAGIALLLTGAGAVTVARRRAENGDILLEQA